MRLTSLTSSSRHSSWMGYVNIFQGGEWKRLCGSGWDSKNSGKSAILHPMSLQLVFKINFLFQLWNNNIRKECMCHFPLKYISYQLKPSFLF